MSWARFDDRCPSNPKVALLSDAAFRLWFTAICYSCEHLTDGEIQRDVPAILTRAPSGAKLRACIRELVDRGLWRETENGWEVHDFLDWNPSGEQVRAKREARAKAGRKGGKRSGESRSRDEARPKQLLQQTGSSGESKTNPVPVPVPSSTEEVDPKDVPGGGRAPAPGGFPPRISDPLMDSFTGRLPDQRSDVRRLFEAWKRTFRFTGDTLRRPSDFRAKVLAEAIDDYGLEACERVLAHAPNDGMVSGRDDEKRVKHESIEYIFGNANTFARILRAADESERNGSTSAAEMVAALKRRKVAP